MDIKTNNIFRTISFHDVTLFPSTPIDITISFIGEWLKKPEIQQ